MKNRPSGRFFIRRCVPGSGSVYRLHAEADAALLVDLEHLHLDHIAFLELVADLLDALVGDLRDVHQAIATRQDGDERAEVHQLRHLALVDAADFHVRGDLLDLLLRGFAGVAINGGDLDGAVILDLDHRAGFVLDGAHDRTALADDVTDLVDLDLHGDDARRPVGHFLARLADDLVHLFKDVQPCFMRLRQRILHDLGRDAGDLDVHLQGGDAAARTRNLEVHVAEVILVAHDVGEHGVTVAFLHQTHGDTRHRLLARHAGIHQRQRGAADGSHRAGTVGFGDLGNDANDVRILAHVRHHGLDAALGQAAVADLATLRRTDEAG